jgi:hypothetical protein
MKQPTSTAGAWTPDRRPSRACNTAKTHRLHHLSGECLFQPDSTETLDDKVLRLIRNDTMREKAADNEKNASKSNRGAAKASWLMVY